MGIAFPRVSRGRDPPMFQGCTITRNLLEFSLNNYGPEDEEDERPSYRRACDL